MTKTVRIENADTATYRVRVRTFEKGVNGGADTIVSEAMLDYPTRLTEQMITSSRYIIVDEVPVT